MTCSDIEKLAASGSEMPNGLKMPEQLLFLTLQGLYHNFKTGAINREQGRRIKSRILVAYQQVQREQDVLDQHKAIRRRLEKSMGSLHKCDCPTCRKVARIFDGIDRTDIPENIEELQATNDRLREMVKQLNERNAELRTILEVKYGETFKRD